MCGYIGRLTDSPFIQALLHNLGLGEFVMQGGDYYPFRPIQGMLIEEDNQIKSVDPIWFYELIQKNGTLQPNTAIMSFNARDLHKPRWAEPLALRRGIIVADRIGESNPKPTGKGKDQFYMESNKGLIIGTLYRTWQTDQGLIYSMTTISRDPHVGFSRYHKKAFPLFLPHSPEFIKLWLSKDIHGHAEIAKLLESPKLFVDLNVTRVKSYKSAEALAPSELLTKDL